MTTPKQPQRREVRATSFIGRGIVVEKSLNQVGKMAKSNHIWLNTFSCINPTTDFKIGLAETILAKLNDKDSLLHKEDSLSNMLYLSINKS